MEKMKNVLYYNTDGDLAYEKGLLKQWGVDDLALYEVKDPDQSIGLSESLHKISAEGLVVIYDLVTEEIIKDNPSLQIISLQSVGYNNIDIEAANKYGVCVTNVPGYCADEVAEHTIGLMLDLARSITFFDRTVQNGSWDLKRTYPMHRLQGQTLGLVFFGAIPKKIAPVAISLGMKVLVYAPTKDADDLRKFGCEKADTLDQLLETSDFVSLHCPLIEGLTYHLIGRHELSLMKKDAFLINTARGAIVDEEALYHALVHHEIRAAAVDVIEDEANHKSRLLGLDNCIITPHSAFLSEDSYYEAKRRCLHNLVERLSDKGEGKYNSL
ncbi:MAG: C-terminal binding protein [Lachnospiraceae bacterium]|nr:C-terminal binding protein [Lachnospiraceae bacterium]